MIKSMTEAELLKYFKEELAKVVKRKADAECERVKRRYVPSEDLFPQG